MLERASACLDSGVRLSLRAQRRAPKSRRLLHSHFWRHAAIDLDLPPYILHATCPPSCPPPQSQPQPQPQTSPSSSSLSSSSSPLSPLPSQPQSPSATPPPTSASASASTCTIPNQSHPSDGPFLDFLYPAQTLAFMGRISTTHLDRIWDRRAAHKTSAKGIRGYSSLTVPATTQDTQQSSSDQQLRPALGALLPYLHKPIEELALLFQTYPHGPDSDATVSRAWNLYATLDDKARSDPAITAQLLVWFAKQPTQAASAHIINLFAALPQHERSAPTYHAVVAAYLATHRLKEALQIHDRALDHHPVAPVGSDALMLRAVDSEDWGLAWEIHQQIDARKKTAASQRSLPEDSSTMKHHLSTPWLDLPHAPNLVENIVSLASHYNDTSIDKQRQSELLLLFESMWRALVYMEMAKPAFKMPGHDGNRVRHRLMTLLTRLDRRRLPSPELYEFFILQIKRFTASAVIESSSEMIATAYRLYRGSNDYKPSRFLLYSLIRFWRRQTLALAGRGPRSSTLYLKQFVQDMERHHGGLDDRSIFIIMDCLAHIGLVDEVKRNAQKYLALHPEGIDSSYHLWPLVYVHARNSDPTGAKTQLQSMKTEYGVDPSLRCWNVVIHAYEKTNDLEGALATLNELLSTTLAPDDYTFTPVLNLYAKQGDVDRVVDLLALAKSYHVQLNTHMLNALVIAHVNNEDMESAERVMEEAVKLVNEGGAHGQLTICFNTVLTAHSLLRNIEATMTIYRRMKAEGIRLDANTYGALIQVLCLFRQTDAAHKIIRTVMGENHIRPLALHYAIVVIGYVKQHMYEEALAVEAEMQEARVRPTKSTRIALLKAKTMHEHASKGGDKTFDDGSPAVPLKDTIDHFMSLLQATPVAPADSQATLGLSELDTILPVDADFLVYIHGKRRAFQAAEKISDMYMAKLAETVGNPDVALPLDLVTALMSVSFRARDYAEVDQYWNLALRYADSVRTFHSSETSKLFTAGPSTGSDGTAATKEVPSQSSPQIPPAYRFILSRPLRYYLASQFSQGSSRASGAMTVLVSSLLTQGYRFDNRTWNSLIVHICRCSPPRALLAFALTEKFLIGNWPGWISTKSGTITNRVVWPKRSARAMGVEYLINTNNTRYRSPGTLIPQYKTMVYLASALLELRSLEAAGVGGSGANTAGRTTPRDRQAEAHREIGSLRDIRLRAPKTLQAVQSMPRVNDRLQQRLIRK